MLEDALLYGLIRRKGERFMYWNQLFSELLHLTDFLVIIKAEFSGRHIMQEVPDSSILEEVHVRGDCYGRRKD